MHFVLLYYGVSTPATVNTILDGIEGEYEKKNGYFNFDFERGFGDILLAPYSAIFTTISNIIYGLHYPPNMDITTYKIDIDNVKNELCKAWYGVILETIKVLCFSRIIRHSYYSRDVFWLIILLLFVLFCFVFLFCFSNRLQHQEYGTAVKQKQQQHVDHEGGFYVVRITCVLYLAMQ